MEDVAWKVMKEWWSVLMWRSEVTVKMAMMVGEQCESQ
jgi:hypothetical protein